MPQPVTLFDKLIQLVIDDKLDKAIDLLLDKVKKSDADNFEVLIQLRARYTANENERMNGSIAMEDYIRTKNEIRLAFQKIISLVNERLLSRILNDSENEFEIDRF